MLAGRSSTCSKSGIAQSTAPRRPTARRRRHCLPKLGCLLTAAYLLRFLRSLPWHRVRPLISILLTASQRITATSRSRRLGRLLLPAVCAPPVSVTVASRVPPPRVPSHLSITRIADSLCNPNRPQRPLRPFPQRIHGSPISQCPITAILPPSSTPSSPD